MTRRLTEEEIEQITSFIQPNNYIPKEVSDSLVSKLKDSIVKPLKNVQVYPEIIPYLADKIKNEYFNTLVQPGECVGVLTAQCIGEKQTQSNLNSFHKCGSSDNQPVVSKFAELLNATSKPKAPSFQIYFKSGNETVADIRATMEHDFVQLTLSHLVRDVSFHLNKVPEKWYDAFFVAQESSTDYEHFKERFTDCISVQINTDLLYEYRLKLADIADVFNSSFNDICCIHSPDCFGRIDIFVDTNISLDDDKIAHVREENKKSVYLEEVVYPTIEHHSLCGIQGIAERFFLQDSKTKEWFVETRNLQEKEIIKKKFKGAKEKTYDSLKRYKSVLAHPRVDMVRTISNNVWDILHALGIEAARAYMIREFSTIMEGINLCHIAILVDKMTFSGSISSISRYGMRRDDAGVLNRASFEETLDNLLNAGTFCQNDPITGVSASIICGKIAQLGTGLCNLSMNLKKLGVIKEEEKEIEEPQSESEIELEDVAEEEPEEDMAIWAENKESDDEKDEFKENKRQTK